jgi:serine/threonine protein kinase
MELACGGDLQQKLFSVGHLSEQTAKYFFIQMVLAIKYCHAFSPPIAHHDLNPVNVLLTDSSDFAGVLVSSPHVLQNVFFLFVFCFVVMCLADPSRLSCCLRSCWLFVAVRCCSLLLPICSFPRYR